MGSARADCGQSRRPLEGWRGSLVSGDLISVLPVTFRGAYRSAYPADRNNGQLWAGRGVSAGLSAGIALRIGRVTLSLEPEFTISENRPFKTATQSDPAFAGEAYPYGDVTIDWPQRFGSDSYREVTTGSSFLELVLTRNVRLGLSTEVATLGPAMRFPLFLGSTASGFPHVYLDVVKVPTPVGDFSVSALWGSLTSSDFFVLDDDFPDKNLLSVLTIGWADPSEVVEAEITVSNRQPYSGSPPSLGGIFWFLRSDSGQSEAEIGEDILAGISLSVQLTETARAYGTFGRGDFFLDIEDALTELDHSAFWSAGMTWEGPCPLGSCRVLFESVTTASSSSLRKFRSGAGVYRHANARAGHTHRGQLLGASIGPGGIGSFLSFGFDVPSVGEVSAELERVAWDHDAFAVEILPAFPQARDDVESSLGVRLRSEGIARSLSGRIDLNAFAGVALRNNRLFLAVTEAQAGQERKEGNLIIDLHLSWAPGSSNWPSSSPPPKTPRTA